MRAALILVAGSTQERRAVEHPAAFAGSRGFSPSGQGKTPASGHHNHHPPDLVWWPHSLRQPQYGRQHRRRDSRMTVRTNSSKRHRHIHQRRRRRLRISQSFSAVGGQATGIPSPDKELASFHTHTHRISSLRRDVPNDGPKATVEDWAVQAVGYGQDIALRRKSSYEDRLIQWCLIEPAVALNCLNIFAKMLRVESDNEPIAEITGHLNCLLRMQLCALLDAYIKSRRSIGRRDGDILRDFSSLTEHNVIRCAYSHLRQVGFYEISLLALVCPLKRKWWRFWR